MSSTSMGRNRVFAALLCTASLLLIALDAAGQTAADATRTPLPPGVGIHIEATPQTGTVGDPIRIDLDITMPAGYRVEIPRPEVRGGDFTILDFFPGPTVPETGAPQTNARKETPQHHRARILTAVYKTGKFTFPSIRMKLKTAEGRELAISSPPVNIEIQSVLTGTNRTLKDLKKQAEIKEPGRWILWFILALAAFALGIAAWRFWQRRQRRPVPLSPRQTANLLNLAEVDLRNLLARGFPDGRMVKQFYVLLSEIVKRILEAGYKIHTAEQTTSEIMDVLRSRSGLESEVSELIESFLLRCDVVKFAKYVPSRAEHEAASKQALQILAQARKAVGNGQSAVGSR